MGGVPVEEFVEDYADLRCILHGRTYVTIVDSEMVFCINYCPMTRYSEKYTSVAGFLRPNCSFELHFYFWRRAKRRRELLLQLNITCYKGRIQLSSKADGFKSVSNLFSRLSHHAYYNIE